MHPDLVIAKTDLMPDTLQEVWTICKDRKLTHLIYIGVRGEAVGLLLWPGVAAHAIHHFVSVSL